MITYNLKRLFYVGRCLEDSCYGYYLTNFNQDQSPFKKKKSKDTYVWIVPFLKKSYKNNQNSEVIRKCIFKLNSIDRTTDRIKMPKKQEKTRNIAMIGF